MRFCNNRRGFLCDARHILPISLARDFSGCVVDLYLVQNTSLSLFTISRYIMLKGGGII